MCAFLTSPRVAIAKEDGVYSCISKVSSAVDIDSEVRSCSNVLVRVVDTSNESCLAASSLLHCAKDDRMCGPEDKFGILADDELESLHFRKPAGKSECVFSFDKAGWAHEDLERALLGAPRGASTNTPDLEAPEAPSSVCSGPGGGLFG